MTDIERQALNTLKKVRDHFAVGRQVLNTTYTEVMGDVGQTIAALENKHFGCPTGLHSGKCTCKPPVLGVCIQNGKEYKS